MPYDAAILLEEPPVFEFRGGMFYIVIAGLPTRVMRPNTFFAAVAAAAHAGRQFGKAEVVPLRKRGAR